MKTCAQIQLENLLTLIKDAGGDEALAEKYECQASYIRQLKLRSPDSKTGTPKGIGEKAARKLERCMGKEVGWLDNDHSDFGLEQFRKLDPAIRAALMRKSDSDDEQKPDGTYGK